MLIEDREGRNSGMIFYKKWMAKKRAAKYWKPLFESARLKGCNISPSCNIAGTVFEGHNLLRNCNLGDSFIGYGSYVLDGSQLINCKIGRFCSIGNQVLVVAEQHPTNFVSTWPYFFNTINKDPTLNSFSSHQSFNEYRGVIDPETKKTFAVIIGNDVWIGTNVLIKGGVTIGHGAVIGMGSVVTKDVPPYAIVGGNPAHLIRYRFEGDVVERLLRSEWWDLSPEELMSIHEDFNDPLKFCSDVENIRSK